KCAARSGLLRCKEKEGRHPNCDSIRFLRVCRERESQNLLLVSHNVAVIRHPKIRTRDEGKFLRSVTVHRWSLPAARPQPVRARPRGSSGGLSKTVVLRNSCRRQNHPRAHAIQPAFPHSRAMQGTPPVQRATAAFRDYASTASRRCS